MIIDARPPNFELIVAAFPDAAKPGVIFAYGDDIYAPGVKHLPPALWDHEAVHQRFQKNWPLGPEGWWDRYIEDPEFRYIEELRAHAAEYRAQLAGLNRNQRAKLLMATAARLVAPLYAYKGKGINTAMADLRRELKL